MESAEPPPTGSLKEISTMEKIYGFEEIFKELKETSGPSAVDPNFNYNLGVASREMGFLDDAIEQFQTALEKRQNPFDTANMLGLCYKEKGQWDEAARAFEKAMHMGGVSKEKILEVKYELGMVYKKQGKTEEALALLREISAGDKKYRIPNDEIAEFGKRARPQGKPLA